MTTEQLHDLMKSKESLVLIDVRPKEQWDSSESKLPGAVNEDPFEAEEWSKFYSKDMTVVLY
jgi:rhodanese-related sulfurtransferase